MSSRASSVRAAGLLGGGALYWMLMVMVAFTSLGLWLLSALNP